MLMQTDESLLFTESMAPVIEAEATPVIAPVIELSPEQQRILEFGIGNQVVLAGAGTGKTETLTQRVLHLLTKGAAQRPCELHQLLALTFTDKAAAEMRQRIYQGILKRLSEPCEEAERSRLERLRADFAEHNRIGTFDSFNHRLLSLYPEQAHVPQGFETMTDYDRRDLRMQLKSAFWEYAEGLSGRERNDLFELLHQYDRSQLLNMLDQMAMEEKGVLLRLAHEIEPSDYANEISALVEEAKQRASRRASRAMEEAWDRYIRALPCELPAELEENFTSRELLCFSEKSSVVTKETKLTAKLTRQYPEFCARMEVTALPHLRRWRELDKKRAEALLAFQINDENLVLDVQSRAIVQRLAKFALWWQEKRRELCWQQRWIDFTDMQRATLRLLQDASISRKLRQTYRHILIDEFQDTNIEQWKLIECFRNEDNVLIVGDEKQAIYAFRGGDITVFDEVRRQLIGTHEADPLVQSFRSTPPIIEFCNRLFRELLPTVAEREVFEAPFQALSPAKSTIDECTGVHVIRRQQAASRRQEDASEEILTTGIDNELPDERPYLADAVACLLADIQADALQSADARLRRPEFASISQRIRNGEQGVVGILFRTHERKAEFETALQKHKVRYTSVKGIGFYQAEQVRDTINLVNFFFAPDDSLALTGILRSPLVGLSDQALLELRIHYPHISLWQALNDMFLESNDTPHSAFHTLHLEADRRALTLAYPRLKRWHSRSQIDPVSEVIELIWRESELAFYDAGLADAPQRAENWRKVVEVLRDRENRGRGSLRELATYLVEQAAEESREADAALPDGGAIQLMTIYAAKGLGFPMVIVGQMDDVPMHATETLKRGTFPTRDDVQYCVKVEEPEARDRKKRDPVLWTILREEARAQQEAEFRRLLYVACTRAKEHLVLVLPEKFKSGSWAEMMSPFVQDLPLITFTPTSTDQEAASSDPLTMELLVFDETLLQPLSPVSVPTEIDVAELKPSPPTPLPITGEGRDGQTPLLTKEGAGEVSKCVRVMQCLLRLNLAPDHQRQYTLNLVRTHDLPDSDVDRLLQQVEAVKQWFKEQGLDLSQARHSIPFSIPATANDSLLPREYEGVKWVNGTFDLLIPVQLKDAASGYTTPVQDGVVQQLNFDQLMMAEETPQEWAVIKFESYDEDDNPEELNETFGWHHHMHLYTAAARVLGLKVQSSWLILLGHQGCMLSKPMDCL